MIKCWSFNPENRPTFKHCLEALTRLKELTDNFTLITDTCVINPTDATSGESKSNKNKNKRKTTEIIIIIIVLIQTDCDVRNDESRDGDVKEIYESHKSNSGTGTEPHRYLELIYEKEAQDVDGYEIPRFSGHNNKLNKMRTFSTKENSRVVDDLANITTRLKSESIGNCLYIKSEPYGKDNLIKKSENDIFKSRETV